MIVDRMDGTRERLENLSNAEVISKTTDALEDPVVTRIEIRPNRHERRKQAALARKDAKKDRQ